MNERLADLTPAEIAEAALSDPRIAAHIAARDPRVQLMERLYGDPESKKAIQQHSKRLFPRASVPEIDIPAMVRGELQEDVAAIKTLRADLEDDKKTRRHMAFRAKLQEAGADAEDLDAIETFMVDNEIGPKSLTVAVEKYYDARELAEPRGGGLSPEMPLDSKDEHMKALLATGPTEDLDRVNAPWVDKVFTEMFGSPARRR
jgi:hypothetical protein